MRQRAADAAAVGDRVALVGRAAVAAAKVVANAATAVKAPRKDSRRLARAREVDALRVSIEKPTGRSILPRAYSLVLATGRAGSFPTRANVREIMRIGHGPTLRCGGVSRPKAGGSGCPVALGATEAAASATAASTIAPATAGDGVRVLRGTAADRAAIVTVNATLVAAPQDAMPVASLGLARVTLGAE